MAENSSFIPGTSLQFAWDSTSTGTFITCKRKYYYSIIEGWTPRQESVHLTFGLLYHGATERYDHARSEGKSHLEAQIAGLRWALEQTWNRELGRPWASDDPNKNRFTLIRTLVWYWAQFAEDPVKTVILDSGKPAVELSFRFELDFTTSSGQPFLLAGHLDRLGEFNDKIYILDKKTTKSALGEYYFDQYSPHNQFDTYMFGANVVWSVPVHGLIVDAAQVGATFSRFQRGIVNRTQSQLDEWYRDLKATLLEAEYAASENYWPMNRSACGNYGGCPFRPICGRDPAVREQWLRASFTRRVWNPLETRGDV